MIKFTHIQIDERLKYNKLTHIYHNPYISTFKKVMLWETITVVNLFCLLIHNQEDSTDSVEIERSIYLLNKISTHRHTGLHAHT